RTRRLQWSARAAVRSEPAPEKIADNKSPAPVDCTDSRRRREARIRLLPGGPPGDTSGRRRRRCARLYTVPASERQAASPLPPRPPAGQVYTAVAVPGRAFGWL